MIALRTWGGFNPVGLTGTTPSQFISVPAPVGMQDGDLVLVALPVPAGVTITPPSSDWSLVGATNPAQDGLAVYRLTVLNAPTRWVFTASSSAKSIPALAVVYSGVADVEAVVAQLTATGTTNVAVGANSVALPGEEVVAFGSATGHNGFSAPPSPYVKIVEQSAGDYDVVSVHSTFSDAGPVPTFNLSYGASVGGATLSIVLRPSVGTVSIDDVRRRIVGALPAGADEVYDLTSTGDYYKLFQAMAEAFKSFAFDLVDLLRSEIIPSRSFLKLPSWESIFGLVTTRTARIGTVPQRQAQVLAAFRAAAGQDSSIPVIQSAIAPLLGYTNSSDLQVIEADRAALRTAHTYVGADAPYTVADNSSVTIPLLVLDMPRVAAMGAQVHINITHPSVEHVSVQLTGPDDGGTVVFKNWTNFGSGSVTNQDFYFNYQDAAGGDIYGTWTIKVLITGTGGTVNAADLFVEGIGYDDAGHDGLAAGVFDFGVYADPLHLGENGTPPDIEAARDALARIAQAHDYAPAVLVGLGVNPDDDDAIPDACIPV